MTLRVISTRLPLLLGWLLACACTSASPSVPSFDAPPEPSANGQGAASGVAGAPAVVDEPSCEGAACICPTGQSACAGSTIGGSTDAMACVDTAVNGAHCGACGRACPPSQVCFNGQCSAQCGPGFTACGSSCAELSADPNNCGACGLVCGSGACAASECPAGKSCSLMTTLVGPGLADFEGYTSGAPVDTFGFAFNATPGDPRAVYAGPYQYGDGTGAQALSMVPGNSSNFAVRLANTGASAWGGALGLWMGCIDASSFDGIAFSVRGQVPGGAATLNVPTEGTSAPDANDPNAGGTCSAGCASATAEFAVGTDWSRVRLPWSAFAPGTAAGASVPLGGSRVTGLTFNVALEWGEDPAAAGTYGPEPGAYELVVDDIEFFRTAEECATGEQICSSQCVNPNSNAEHCQSCGNACSGGAVCSGEQGCLCPNGLAFCAGACVDLASEASHCGSCGNFCSIGSACTGGQCQGGGGATSNRCGTTTRRLGNPLGCEFGWGANPDGAIPDFVDFATRWVGYEPNIDTRCDGCGWLGTFQNSSAVPTFIAYLIAYRANIEAGLGDCNLDFDGNNLCNGGAQWIRDNRARVIALYESYARRSYAVAANRPVIWIVEPDFSQYAEPGQQNPLSMAELGQLASDIICAIKGNMPNAVIALNHSTWLGGAELRNFWNAMPLDLIDMLHITSSSNVPGGYFNTGDANNREDGTFAFLSQLTGRPIIADTSFGVTTMNDSWSTASAATLNARIADGVVGALVYPTPNDYAQRINALGPGLDSTCQ